MNDNNRVRLLVEGMDYGGWKSVSISTGITRQARDFTLAVTLKWPEVEGFEVRAIAPGDTCQVLIGDDLVLTGYVDARPIKYDAAGVTVEVRGRSKTADVIDCAALGSQWKGRTITQIAADLAKPFGVGVSANTDIGAPLTHQIQQGETAFESIDRMLKLRAILSTDTEAGDLLLTRSGVERAETALVLGENILSGDCPFDMGNRFSEYQVKGQKAGNDQVFAEGAASVTAGSVDTGVKRYRPTILTAEGNADAGACRDRAAFEAAVRAGNSIKTTYTVQGWRQSENGSLWKVNQLVRVVDWLLDFDREMLIGELTYTLSDSGMIATLVVAPPETFKLLPVADKKKGEGGGDWMKDVIPGGKGKSA